MFLIEGDVVVAQHLLKLPFNHIFFTGSPEIGRLVMKAASDHLASVTLELGGKSPVIIDNTANLKLAVSRVVHSKLINTGQTCIAPDYVFIPCIMISIIQSSSLIVPDYHWNMKNRGAGYLTRYTNEEIAKNMKEKDHKIYVLILQRLRDL